MDPATDYTHQIHFVRGLVQVYNKCKQSTFQSRTSHMQAGFQFIPNGFNLCTLSFRVFLALSSQRFAYIVEEVLNKRSLT